MSNEWLNRLVEDWGVGGMRLIVVGQRTTITGCRSSEQKRGGGFALFEVSCALETGEWLSDQTSLVDQIQRELTDPFQDGFNWLIPWW